MPPQRGGKSIPTKRLIAVLQGWNVTEKEIAAQKKLEEKARTEEQARAKATADEETRMQKEVEERARTQARARSETASVQTPAAASRANVGVVGNVSLSKVTNLLEAEAAAKTRALSMLREDALLKAESEAKARNLAMIRGNLPQTAIRHLARANRDQILVLRQPVDHVLEEQQIVAVAAALVVDEELPVPNDDHAGLGRQLERQRLERRVVERRCCGRRVVGHRHRFVGKVTGENT